MIDCKAYISLFNAQSAQQLEAHRVAETVASRDDLSRGKIRVIEYISGEKIEREIFVTLDAF